MTDDLRAALAQSAERGPLSPAPVADILRAGRSRRARRRGGLVAAAACVVAAGTALALTGPTTPAAGQYQASVMTGGDSNQHVAPQTVVLARTQVAGRAWSVLVVYYPSAPQGCKGLPGVPNPPANAPLGTAKVDASSTGGTGTSPFPLPTTTVRATPPKLYALVMGASTDGGTISHMLQCEANPVGWKSGSDSLLGDVPLLASSGPHVFIGEPAVSVTSATMTLSDGTKLTSPVVRLAESGRSAYAFVVPDHLKGKSLDEYDTHHHLVSHQTL